MTSMGKPNGCITQRLSRTDRQRGAGGALSLKPRKLTKALSLPSAHHSKAGTRDSLDSLVVEIKTYCIPTAKGKAHKPPLGLRDIRTS